MLTLYVCKLDVVVPREVVATAEEVSRRLRRRRQKHMGSIGEKSKVNRSLVIHYGCEVRDKNCLVWDNGQKDESLLFFPVDDCADRE